MSFLLRFLGCEHDEGLALVSSLDSAIDMVDSNSLAFVSALVFSLNDKLPKSGLRDTMVLMLWSLSFEFTET